MWIRSVEDWFLSEFHDESPRLGRGGASASRTRLAMNRDGRMRRGMAGLNVPWLAPLGRQLECR